MAGESFRGGYARRPLPPPENQAYGTGIGTALGGIIGAYFGNPQAGMAIGGSGGGLVDRYVNDEERARYEAIMKARQEADMYY